MLRYFLVFIICFGVYGMTMGQKKYEKESDVYRSEVPNRALDFIESVELDSKINWFYEENLKGNSVEAKFSYKAHQYSVEFDTLGYLQDIEVEIPLNNLAERVILKMKENLKGEFAKSSILRVQKQYSGNINSFETFLGTTDEHSSYTVRYETEIKGKKNKRMKLYEVLFTSEGFIEHIDEVIFRNNDYLEF